MVDTLELLRSLSEAPGISGYEEGARALIHDALVPLADEVRGDALGNLIALQRGTGPEPRRAIMLAAHMDEIGLMVSSLEGAFIRFAPVGGVDLRTLVGQEVTVHGHDLQSGQGHAGCDLPGIVASRPPHVLSAEERSQAVPLERLFIDTGLTAAGLREHVRVGDLITMRRSFTALNGGYATGKALDDRAGVVSLVLCLEALRYMAHSWDVYAVATTQEEIGLRGATVSAYGIAPDLGIAVDVGFGRQQGVTDSKLIDMDGGPAVALGPNVHPAMRARLMATAKSLEIKVQTEVVAGASGTDGWALQVAREGIPTVVLSIPLRYMHTS
ncbi:MAG: zinc-binding metallopeptidase family protein, partial [Anaerolineae bacterium]